eukprot:scaffold17.g529.t1
MAAAAQPQDGESVEDVLKELAGGDLRGNPFSMFARRATLVITGLVHISILLLPKSQTDGAGGEPGSPPAATAAVGSSSRAGGAAAGGGSGGGGGPAAAGGTSDPAAELRAAGFPADSSDLQRWEQVQGILDRTATGGLDWTNCCVYRVTEEGGATVQPTPPHPLSCTAAYHATRGSGNVVISNDFEKKGPHFADWRALYEAGARSMAAAPMYVQQRVVGVLSLASAEPHAFDRCRLVWLLAMVLVPFVSALRYTSQALEMEAFIQRIMPPLLEQNYLRNTAQKRPAAASAGAVPTRKPPRGPRERPAAAPTAASQADPAPPRAPTLAGPAPDSGATAASGSDQFAQNAEVLITGAAGGHAACDLLAPPTPAGMAASPAASLSDGGPPLHSADDRAPRKAGGSVRMAGRAARANGRARRDGSLAGSAPALSVAISNSMACDVLPGATSDNGTLGGCGDPLDPYALSSSDSDLDWGDFFFNLISMCIVYAYFSEAAVGGESQAAIVVSMCIAAIDIVLLALRWLWYEQYITAGGAVLQAFQAYRLLVLPVANTWMSWSLLNKLGITPGGAVVAAIGCVVLACLMRFFLHAPLQLASVLFAASSTTKVCSRFFASTTGLGCMSAVSLVQLSLGVFVPTLLGQLLDARSAGDKPAFLPHVQAKRWLLNGGGGGL